MPYFYGLQPSSWKWDRLYRVYVNDRMIAGAYIAGQIYDRQTAAITFHQLGPLLHPLIRRRLGQRSEREEAYDSVDPFAIALLDHDARNFQLHRSDVVRMRFRRKRSLRAPFNVGSVEIEMFDGTKRLFVLVGDQNQDEILTLLQTFDPAVEVIGAAIRRPRVKPTPSRGKRIGLGIAGAAMLCVGVASAFAGKLLHLEVLLVPLAFLISVAAGWLLVEAGLIKDDRPGPG